MIWIGIVLFVIAIDQASKIIVANNINYTQKIEVIEHFFYLTHVTNSGAAWGMFKNGRIFILPLTVIMSLVIIYILSKTDSGIQKVALSLILGGALGNLIDRFFRNGYVIDFLEFHFGSFVFPVFNVADSFIVIGTVLLSYCILFSKEKNLFVL